MENVMNDIQDKIKSVVQDLFNREAKPLILKEMKRLKIKSIKSVMGVLFITLNNGKEFSDSEFKDSSLVRRKFLEELVEVWEQNHWCSLIYIDIEV